MSSEGAADQEVASTVEDVAKTAWDILNSSLDGPGMFKEPFEYFLRGLKSDPGLASTPCNTFDELRLIIKRLLVPRHRWIGLDQHSDKVMAVAAAMAILERERGAAG